MGSAVSALLSPSWTSTAPSRVTARVLTVPEPGGVMLTPTTAPARTSGSPPTPGLTRPVPPHCPTLPWLPWFPPTLTSPPLPIPSLSSRSILSTATQSTATQSTATLSTATPSLSTDPTLGLCLPIILVSLSPRRPEVQDLLPRTPSSSRLLAVSVPQDI